MLQQMALGLGRLLTTYVTTVYTSYIGKDRQFGGTRNRRGRLRRTGCRKRDDLDED
jgi:hypothetical protein